MRAYTAAQIRAAERPLLEAGVPLMQRAAGELAAQMSALLEGRHGERSEWPAHGRALLVVGSGNNGGDALFAGAIVGRTGVDVDIARTSDRVHTEGLAAAERAGAREVDGMTVDLADYDLVVDAILGTGTRSGGLRGRAREIVERMLPQLEAERHPLVIACDMPSGVDPDTGELADDIVLPADVTVTFGGVKIGMLREPGASRCGHIVLADVGLGRELARFDGEAHRRDSDDAP